jgi:hypothetical protein
VAYVCVRACVCASYVVETAICSLARFVCTVDHNISCMYCRSHICIVGLKQSAGNYIVECFEKY